MPKGFPLSIIFCLLFLLMLPACRSTNRLLKAKPVKLSPFFEQPELVMDTRKTLPFQKAWIMKDKAVEPAKKTKLYVAPVSLEHLRPMKKILVRNEVQWGSIDRREEEMANRLRKELAKAFQRSPQPRYRIVQQPGICITHRPITPICLGLRRTHTITHTSLTRRIALRVFATLKSPIFYRFNEQFPR